MHATQLAMIGLFCAAASGAAAQDVFRCERWIIDTRLTAPEVLAKCGEPDSRDVAAVPIKARGVRGAVYTVGTTSLEHWVYERSPGQFPVFLTFDQGRLKDIEFLDRP